MGKTFTQMAAEAFESVPSLSPAELNVLLQGEPKPLVIDVRDAADIVATGTIPGAINISYGSLTYKADNELPDEWRDLRLQDRSRVVVTTCVLGPLGALGGKLLKDMGFEHVYILNGGVQAWIEAGFPTEQPA
jgi:rhodanese-related sulfurtransferase